MSEILTEAEKAAIRAVAAGDKESVGAARAASIVPLRSTA